MQESNNQFSSDRSGKTIPDNAQGKLTTMEEIKEIIDTLDNRIDFSDFWKDEEESLQKPMNQPCSEITTKKRNIR